MRHATGIARQQAGSSVGTCATYLGEVPEALSAWVTLETTALERERTLCSGGNYRFDPLLLVRVHSPGWGSGPAPQPLYYYCKPDPATPIVVADRIERLEPLVSAGAVPANGDRLKLQGRLCGWVLRCLCEAVLETGYTAFSTTDRPERWAQALTADYFGLIALCDTARKGYCARDDVDAKTAGKSGGGTRDVTLALDRVRNALAGTYSRLTPSNDTKEEPLLQAIARAITGGLLQRGGAEHRQIQKMLLGASKEYRIVPVCTVR